MKKSGFITIAVLAAVLAVTCEESPVSKPSPSYEGVLKVVQINPAALLAPGYDADSAARTAARGANDFAFRLSASLVQDIHGKNFVCSPYSVWMPLAALANAANPQATAALLTALGAAGITGDDVNRASSRMLYSLTRLRDKERDSESYYNPLQIANAVFVGNHVTLRTEFAQKFMDFYRGSSINVDFSSHDAVDAVNLWASENTNGLIKNLIQEFDPSTVAAIANAIYFSDRWNWEFNSAQTKEDVFHAAAGEESSAFYMLRQGDASYYEDEKVQALPLGFKHDGGMYIILPKDGDAAGFLGSMTGDYFNGIQRDSVLGTGKLLLPRFSIENMIGLKGALIALGVPLFEEASLTGLIEEFPVEVTDAIQKAVIEVDEKGTTAAAVTVLLVGNSAGPHEEPVKRPFEMICNKPFVFILYEYTTDGGNQILFTGVVNRP